MGMSFRRVIQPPTEKSGTDAGSLADRLARNVQLQRELAARSPHILQFTSDLQSDETGFYVEHEPATPHHIPIFDSDVTPRDEDDLLRWAVALADALRAAHDHTDPVVHGSLCPGTMLTTPDGIQKITDFGFAPSISAELGVDEYVNLCLQSAKPDDPDAPWTGQWTILSPDVEHNDRICGFIDPRKYGDQTLHTFEPGSDIISAGFLLHLMAELRHPYLNDNQDLRLPELAESMAYFFYDGARRSDLRDSSDPRTKVWCEMVQKMLANVANDRPTATQITSAFADVDVRPHTLDQAQEKELKNIADLLAGQSYDDAYERSRSLAASAVSDEIREHADALRHAAQAGVTVMRAAERLGTDDWQLAQDELQGVDRSGLSPKLAELLADTENTLKSYQQVDGRLTTIETTLDSKREVTPSTGQDAKDIDEAMAGLETALSQIDVASAPVSFASRKDALKTSLDQRRQELQNMLAAIDADLKAAREWLSELEEAHRADQRDKVRSMLAGRGELPITHWPSDVLSTAETIGAQIESVERAETWILSFSDLVEQSEADHAKLSDAQKYYGEKPTSDDWPVALKEELEALRSRMQTVEKIVADHAAAEKWIGTVRQAVEKEEWAAAKSGLNVKPTLSHWPENVTAEEQRLKPLIDENLEEQEVIDVWLSSVRDALESGAFVRAMDLAQAPPVQAKKLPKKAKKQAEQWASDAKSKLAEQKQKALADRTEWVKKEVGTLVSQSVAGQLDTLVAADRVETVVDAIEWHSTDVDTTGQGEVTVTVRFQETGDAQRVLQNKVEFECTDGTPRLNNGDQLRDQLVAEMRRAVQAHQVRAADGLVRHFQNGLFPEAAVATSIEQPVDRIQVDVSFLGAKVPDASLQTELVWDTRTGDWTFAEPESVTRRAVEVAIACSKDTVKPEVLKGSDVLRKYGAALSTSIKAPRITQPPVVPTTITFQGELLLSIDNDEPTSLMTFPVDCRRAGEIEIKADLAPAEARLNEIITVRQQTAQADVQKGLEERFRAGTLKRKPTPVVKRIKSPVETVGFLLKPRKGPKVTLQATWNRDRFAFELGAAEEETIKTLMNGAAQGEGKTAKPVEAEAGAAPTAGKRPAVVVVGGLAGVAIVVVAFVIWTRPNDDTNGDDRLAANIPVVNVNDNLSADTSVDNADTTPTDDTLANDNTGPVDPTADNSADNTAVATIDNANDAQPIDTTNLNPGEALNQIRSTLSASSYLGPHVADLVPADSATPENATYTIPGLQAPTRRVRLLAENDALIAPPEELAQISQAAADMTRRLDDEPRQILRDSLARVLASRDFDGFLNTGGVSVGNVAPNWILEPTRKRHWVGDGATASINLSPTRSMPLSRFRFELSNGILSAGPAGAPSSGADLSQFDDLLQNAIRNELSSIMDTETAAWLNGLAQASLPGSALEMDTGAIGDMLTALAIRLSSQDLVTREIQSSWNRDNMRYEPAVDWAKTAGDFLTARRWVQELNDPNNPPSWLARVPSVGRFREPEPSPPGELHLVTDAPWADPQSDDPADQLGFSFPLGADELQMPPIWPALAKYVELSARPAMTGAGPAGDPSSPWSDLPAELQPILNANLQSARLVASFPGKPQLVQEEPVQINARLVATLDAASTTTGMTPAAVRAGLDELTGNTALEFDLTIVPDPSERGGARVTWTAANPNIQTDAIAQQVVQFDELLATYSARSAVELALMNQLSQTGVVTPGRSVTITDADAIRLLSSIWGAKTSGGNFQPPASIAELSKDIRDEDLLSDKGERGDEFTQATILAEYFCGPQSCFAIAWSLTDARDATVDNLSLIGLGAASDILAAANAGSLLFDPVLDGVPEAVAGYDLIAQRPGTVGVVIGLDQPLDLIANPAALQFASRASTLDPLNQTSGRQKDLNWTSLGDLRSSAGSRSDYALLGTLIDLRNPWVARGDTTRRQAMVSAYRALQAAAAVNTEGL